VVDGCVAFSAGSRIAVVTKYADRCQTLRLKGAVEIWPPFDNPRKNQIKYLYLTYHFRAFKVSRIG